MKDIRMKMSGKHNMFLFTALVVVLMIYINRQNNNATKQE